MPNISDRCWAPRPIGHFLVITPFTTSKRALYFSVYVSSNIDSLLEWNQRIYQKAYWVKQAARSKSPKRSGLTAWENQMAEVPKPPARGSAASEQTRRDWKPQQRGYIIWCSTMQVETTARMFLLRMWKNAATTSLCGGASNMRPRQQQKQSRHWLHQYLTHQSNWTHSREEGIINRIWVMVAYMRPLNYWLCCRPTISCDIAIQIE